jgi:hypothetical protein
VILLSKLDIRIRNITSEGRLKEEIQIQVSKDIMIAKADNEPTESMK